MPEDLRPEGLAKSGIFNYSVEQTVAWIKSEYARYSDVDFLVVQVPSATMLRQVDTTLSKPDGSTDKLAYPYALITIGDVSLDPDRVGSRKHGDANKHVTGRDIPDGSVLMEELRPVNVGIGLSFRADSLEDVMNLVHTLLMAHPAVQFVMTGEQGFVVKTQLKIDPSVSIPPLSDDAPGESFVYETVLTLQTWIGTSYRQRLIRNVKFRTISDNGRMSDPFFDEEADGQPTFVLNYKDYFRPGNLAFTRKHRRA